MSIMLNENRKKLTPILVWFIVILSLGLEIVGVICKDENILLLAVCLIWVGLFIKNFHREKFTLLAFYITFFTFLMGTLVIRYFDPTVELRVTKHDTLLHIYISLYVSLFFVNVGTWLARKVRIMPANVNWDEDKELAYKDTDKIKRSSKIVYLLTSVCTLAISLEKAIFVIAGGSYTSYYVNFVSVLPSFVSKISEMSSFAFFIYLATLPDPRKSKLPFAIYLISGVLGLLYGQRNQIVMAVIMLCLYVVLYENYEGKPYSILKKRHCFLGLLLIPFVLVFLEFFKYTRDNMAFEFAGIWESIKSLFTSLGGSVNVIGHGYELKDSFPDGHFYSLGGVIDFITKNALLRPFFGTTIYQGNTIEMALYGNSYGQTITYLGWGSTLYLAGRGMGSCFIAEAFHDLGFFGIALFSSIYGVLLTTANKMHRGHWIRNSIILISLYHILYAPRDSAGAFISAYFNYSFIITIICIVIVSKTIKS